MELRRFVGVDFGQAQDFTALAVLERPRLQRSDPPERRRPTYACRHLHRFPLGTPYTTIVRDLAGLFSTDPLAGAFLAVDGTGVGRAVVNMLTDAPHRSQARCEFRAVTITSGHAVTDGADGHVHVPKKELVSTLQVLFQSHRLQVARELPLAPVLAKELENFRAKITPAGNEVFESWREQDHDDLVLAVALAAWWGERALPPLADRAPRPPFSPVKLTPI